MAQLGDHPYIVQVFRAGTSADGRPYLVMKYYPPPNMAMRARAERSRSRRCCAPASSWPAPSRPPTGRASSTATSSRPTCWSAQYGAPGLTDFGIAGRGGARARRPTRTDDVGVSVPWAPPEVLFVQTDGDARADVYSLAATLWQLLVGRSPFEVPGGDNSAYALMPRIRSHPVPTTGRADVPVSLERLLAQAMAKDPAPARPRRSASPAPCRRSSRSSASRAPPIVVLDEQGQTTLADHSGPRPEDADEDRTRVRSPKAVQAQGPAPARPAPAAYQSRLSGSTTIPSASAAPVTTHHGRPGLAAVHDDAAEEGTVRVDRSRARQASEATEEPTSPETRPQAQISPAVTIGVVAGLVVALVGVGAWALAGRGDTPEPAPTTAAPTVAGPTDDLLSIPQTPAVEARAVAGGVRFGWTYAGRERVDTFRVRVAPAADALGEAKYQVAKEPTHTVKTSKGRQLCAQVQVVRSGTSSVWSEPACEKAG